MKTCLIFIFSLMALNAFSQEIIPMTFNGLSEPVKVYKESLTTFNNQGKIVVAEDYLFAGKSFKLDIKKGTPITFEKSNLYMVKNTNGTVIEVFENLEKKHRPKWKAAKSIYFRENLSLLYFQLADDAKGLIFRVKTPHDIAKCYDFVRLYPSGALENCYLDAPMKFKQGGLMKTYNDIGLDQGMYENGTIKSIFVNRTSSDDYYYLQGCSKPTRIEYGTFNEEGFGVRSVQLVNPIKFAYEGRKIELDYITDIKDCKADFLVTGALNALYEGFRIISSELEVSDEKMTTICKKLGFLESFKDTKTVTEFIVADEKFYNIDTNSFQTIKSGNVKIAPVAFCGMYIEIPLN